MMPALAPSVPPSHARPLHELRLVVGLAQLSEVPYVAGVVLREKHQLRLD